MFWSALFKAQGPSIDVQTLYQRILAEPCTLIDVREPSEFKAGHVPGAVNIPLDQLEKATLHRDRSESLHVMCQRGWRSLSAQGQLHALGFESVTNVKGGFNAWKAARLPLQRSHC